MIRVIFSGVLWGGPVRLDGALWLITAKSWLQPSAPERLASCGDGECAPSLSVAAVPLRLPRALSEVAVRVGAHQAWLALGLACGDVEVGKMATRGGRDGA